MNILNPLVAISAAIIMILEGIATRAEIEVAVRNALREEAIIDHSCLASEEIERENCRVYLSQVMNRSAILLDQLAISKCESHVIRIAFEQALERAATATNDTQLFKAIEKIEELGSLLQQNTLKYSALIHFQEKERLPGCGSGC